MCASLGCGALSAKCTVGANILGNICSLAVTLDSTETPFAKTPFFGSWFPDPSSSALGDFQSAISLSLPANERDNNIKITATSTKTPCLSLLASSNTLLYCPDHALFDSETCGD